MQPKPSLISEDFVTIRRIPDYRRSPREEACASVAAGFHGQRFD
jgi:hypothetical protein